MLCTRATFGLKSKRNRPPVCSKPFLSGTRTWESLKCRSHRGVAVPKSLLDGFESCPPSLRKARSRQTRTSRLRQFPKLYLPYRRYLRLSRVWTIQSKTGWKRAVIYGESSGPTISMRSLKWSQVSQREYIYSPARIHRVSSPKSSEATHVDAKWHQYPIPA